MEIELNLFYLTLIEQTQREKYYRKIDVKSLWRKLSIWPFIKWNELPHEVVSFSSLKDSETG